MSLSLSYLHPFWKSSTHNMKFPRRALPTRGVAPRARGRLFRQQSIYASCKIQACMQNSLFKLSPPSFFRPEIHVRVRARLHCAFEYARRERALRIWVSSSCIFWVRLEYTCMYTYTSTRIWEIYWSVILFSCCSLSLSWWHLYCSSCTTNHYPAQVLQ